ncbi:hypothetical protein MBM_07183 [Drepanopeziza brunnea f. sp. 'multigermtubi' MB_m1]|uniref:Autophagy protein n=1 Tax=Marssonina brunnea f. sp. multigermtubi (strain MB_m1) TaxID=1072389 RepID=K1WPY1_MARBU|nr:uncharacterized protein MBM_07183 [Drepanopeziza brunnea f. sp. 'multigermtubi' MB_m1]EKD14462.1 hypothetical protein MBM_07183 [Drepanopeziza brunnea f. sp. 'multigermtubi' MB_m1]
MGWLWGSSGDDSNKDKDPLRNLDPGLRDFLKKESPVKYSSSNPPAATATAPQPAAVPTPAPSQTPTTTSISAEDTGPQVPSQSLYKDGRYAHLWKTYQSQADAESTAKSDQEKIDDVLQGYKDRKAGIGRAALENCAMEQWEVNDCFSNGSWKSRLTMCSAETRRMERCYMMQGKFLKALGYLSTFDRPPEVDEQIQMHADTLYHRMLAQEKAIEDAKTEGKPVPEFPPLLSKSSSKLSGAEHLSEEDNQLQVSDLPRKMQAEFKKRLEGLSDEEREVEQRAIKAEIQAGEQVARNLGGVFEKQAEERQARKEQGKETIGDKLASVFGFR